MESRYSVLMAVYHREKPEFFRAAVLSMVGQTLPPEQFVIVCDGELGEGLEAVIAELCEQHEGLFEIVRLPENRGLPFALNTGLAHCRCEYVARMDSDDLALPFRAELQLKAMQKHGADICSATIAEFSTDPGQEEAFRRTPRTHEGIMRFARQRNPFNHPCVMYKKSAVTAVGKYEDYPYFEDYQLWIKLLLAGYRGYNVQKVLLKMRTGGGMYSRRGGLSYFKHARKLEDFKLKAGFCSRLDHIKRMSAMLVFCIMPVKLRSALYGRLLRSRRAPAGHKAGERI